MTSHRSRNRLAVLGLAAALLAGCSSPRVTFYTLNAEATPDAAPPAFAPVAIGPVTLPALVDQPQLVVRTGANRVEILEQHRWAEPLKSEIPRVIAANLTLLLNQARVSTYPQNAGQDADYRILLDIQRFELSAGKGVAIDALWSIRRVAGGALQTGRSTVSEPATDGYETLVAAQSRALAAISRDLAGALRVMATPPPQ